MHKISIRRRLALGIGASAMLVAAIAGPALAANEVTQAITGSGLTASVADLTLPSVAYQNARPRRDRHDGPDGRRQHGLRRRLERDDPVVGFVWVGTANGGIDIPAAKFALTSAAAPDLIAGQVVSVAAATGPQVPPTSPLGTLDTPRKTLVATAAYGAGTYTQALGVTLTIPAMSRVGVYTGTLTTTITSAP